MHTGVQEETRLCIPRKLVYAILFKSYTLNNITFGFCFPPHLSSAFIQSPGCTILNRNEPYQKHCLRKGILRRQE